MKPYYQEGGITIYHGDCMEIAPTISGVSLLVTDPPYGMKERTNRASLGRGGMSANSSGRKVRSRDWPAIHGDDQPFDPSPWLTYPKVILFGAIHYSTRLPESRAWLVWDKREGTPSDDNADCDFAWTNLGGPARLYSQLWRGLCKRGEENVSSAGGGLEHPTQKPAALMRWVILRCEPGDSDLLLDPFCGSGSTLVAAKTIGVRAIGIEIDERYCEVAARRLAQGVLFGPEVSA